MHEKDIQRQKKEMDDLMKKGYFTMEDGSKSSEYQAVIKKRAPKEKEVPQKEVKSKSQKTKK